MRRPSLGRRRPGILLPAFMILALILAACGSADLFQNVGTSLRAAGGGADGGAAPEEPVTDTDDSAGEGGVPDGEPPFAAPIEQRIIKTGEITLEVENVAEALGRVRSMVAELNGYVGGSQAGTLDDRATLTVRIPATSFDTALARLHELDADVIAEATREQDVTMQVVDLQARIENLEASEASYRELVARAERVEDILAVQSRLDEVRSQIEQLTAQLEGLETQAALSTLTITLVPRTEPIEQQAATWDPGAQLDRALASLVGIGQGLLDGLIWFAVVWLPILLVLSLLVLIALRGVLEMRRRLPAVPRRGAAAVDDGGAPMS